MTCKADLGSPCTILLINLGIKRHVELYRVRVQRRSKAVQTVHSLHRLSQIYIICDNEVWSTTERKRRTIVGVSDDPTMRAQIRNPLRSPRKIKSSRSNTIRLGSVYRIANEDAIADRRDITIQVVVDQMHVVVIRKRSTRALDRAGEVAVRRREWVLPNLKTL
jgi:hypothetical protein